MLLDDLYQVIEKLRERMETHQDKLRQSEALTRNALVDPLLRALGWNTEDPGQVMPEYKLKVAVGNKGSADYGLMGGENAAMVVEAKKLGTDLSNVVGQGINYCTMNGINYLVCTDGRIWDVYGLLLPGDITKKKIVRFDITDSPADVCLDALVLWRRSVQSGIVRKAQTPLLEVQHEPLVQTEPSPEQIDTTPIPDGNWLPLPKLKPVGKPPEEMRFPDGSTGLTEKTWAGLSIEVVRWLDEKGKLDESRIPIQSGTQYILSSEPVHPDGSKFKHTREVGQFYLNTNYSNAYKVKNASTIIEIAGKEVTPEQFSVLLP